jgi:hypothetical protein
MSIRPLILFAVILYLSACTGAGYNRSYIITDTTNEEVTSESADKR